MARREDEENRNAARKETRRHIFISGPIDKLLKEDDRRKQIWDEIQTEIKRRGYAITAFESNNKGLGHALMQPWAINSVIKVMRQCVGVVLVGFPVAWNQNSKKRKKPEGLASEYCHFEGALAIALGLPVFALLEEGTAKRGAFAEKSGFQPLEIPKDAEVSWLSGREFQMALDQWDEHGVRKRKDLFLGYSSSAKPLASTLKSHLENVRNPRVSTFDWATDLPKGKNVFSAIEEAAKGCGAAILLFTEADQLLGKDDADQPSLEKVPRDNVVFEAGYFAHAKSKGRVLIIREKGVKLLSDLAGDNYIEFDRAFDDRVLAQLDDWIDKTVL